MEKLFFPYYVNKGRLLDIYAILNNGYSEYEELSYSSSSENKKSDKGDMSIELNFKLFKIGGAAGDGKETTNADNTTMSIKKIQTIPSILKIVIDELRDKKYLKTIEESSEGDFVEIESISFQLNSIKSLIEEIDEIVKLIPNLNVNNKNNNKNDISSFKKIANSIKIICNGEEMLYENDKYAVLGNYYNDCLYQAIKPDIFNNKFRCLCQIKRKHDKGTSLMKNTIFTQIKGKEVKDSIINSVVDYCKQSTITFNSIAESEIKDKAVYEVEIIALYK